MGLPEILRLKSQLRMARFQGSEGQEPPGSTKVCRATPLIKKGGQEHVDVELGFGLRPQPQPTSDRLKDRNARDSSP